MSAWRQETSSQVYRLAASCIASGSSAAVASCNHNLGSCTRMVAAAAAVAAAAVEIATGTPEVWQL